MDDEIVETTPDTEDDSEETKMEALEADLEADVAAKDVPLDKAPQDPVTWARVGGSNSWHIVDSYTRGGCIALDGTTMLWPEYRPDLGAEKSCEVCMRIYMQRGDL
jgi:hypothetical protein